MNEILRANIPMEEDSQNISLRPQFLNEFLGQKMVKENLAVCIEAAKSRGEAMDHLFLIGPPGLGKTTLAQITAQELGAEFKVTSAPALEKPKDLAGILSTITEGTVFFIDEIHRLKPAIEEMLYIAMEDYELDWIIGQGAAARTVRIPIPRFTLVGATTKAGMVSSPLISRFGIVQRFSFYTQEELAAIIQRSANILEVNIHQDAALLMAGCSRGTPRVANRLLKRVRDFAVVDNRNTIDEAEAKISLQKLAVDECGLDNLDRRYLSLVIENYAGGPVGIETLSALLSEESDTIEDVIEPYLLQIGFLQRTPRGRMITQKAYTHLGLEHLFIKKEN